MGPARNATRKSIIWTHGSQKQLDDSDYWSCSSCGFILWSSNTAADKYVTAGNYKLKFRKNMSGGHKFSAHHRAKQHLRDAHKIYDGQHALDDDDEIDVAVDGFLIARGEIGDDKQDGMDLDDSADGNGSDQEGNVGPGVSHSKGKTKEQMTISGGRRPTTTTSLVWRHGTRIMVDGRPRWACQYCRFTLEQPYDTAMAANVTQVKQS
jgi:hypothetical protein